MLTGFSRKNSLIHNLNPSLKFIAFIVMIVMIFLPLGFFAQVIIAIFILSMFMFAKLGFKKFWNILKSVMFLFLILFIVNWFIYKTPIAVYVDPNHFPINIGDSTNIPGLSLSPIGNEQLGHSFVSQLWGGNIIGFIGNAININGQSYTLNDIFTLNNYNLENAKDLFEGLSKSNQEHLIKLLGSNDSAIQYYWIIINGFFIDGQKYLVEILSNTNGGIANLQSAVVYQSFWYTLSPRALQLALYISIKVLLMILAATILTYTTSPIELSYALEDILSPLKIVRFPVVEASMVISIALRFVPSLLSESQRILNAQSSRGIDFKNGNLKDKFKAIISLVVPLFNIAFIKSAELANAMEARGYHVQYKRTRYRRFSLYIFDWIWFAILCLVMGVLIGMLIKPLFFAPFGIIELGMLIN